MSLRMNQHLISLWGEARCPSRATWAWCALLASITACTSPQQAALRDAERLLARADVLALAKALDRGGLRSEARQRLVQRLARPWEPGKLQQAVALLARDGFPVLGSPTDALVRRYEAGAFARSSTLARRELGLLVARRLLRQGALRRTKRVLAGLPFDARVGHLQGLLALAANDRRAARRWLTRARKLGGRLAAMLALNEARLALAAGRLAEARHLYTSVPAGSPWAPRARLERAWLELRAKRPREVLTIVAEAETSAIAGSIDVSVLRALALFDLCHPAARAVALRARRHATAAIKSGAFFLRRRADSRLYYIEATAALAGATSAAAEDRGDGGLPAAFQFALSADASFRLVDGFVRQLQRERRILARPEVTILRRRLGARLDRRLVQAQTLAGATVRRLLAQTLAELRELRSRADELLVELDRRAEAQPRAWQGRQQWPQRGDPHAAPWRKKRSALRLRSRCPPRATGAP